MVSLLIPAEPVWPDCTAPAAGATEASLSEHDDSVSLSSGASPFCSIESTSSIRTCDDRDAPWPSMHNRPIVISNVSGDVLGPARRWRAARRSAAAAAIGRTASAAANTGRSTPEFSRRAVSSAIFAMMVFRVPCGIACHSDLLNSGGRPEPLYVLTHSPLMNVLFLFFPTAVAGSTNPFGLKAIFGASATTVIGAIPLSSILAPAEPAPGSGSAPFVAFVGRSSIPSRAASHIAPSMPPSISLNETRGPSFSDGWGSAPG